MHRARQRASTAASSWSSRQRADDEVVEVDAARRARSPARTPRTRARRAPARGRAATSSAMTRRSSLSRENARSSRPRSAAVAAGNSSRSSSSRSMSGSIETPASASISRPSAWNVRTRTAPGRDAERLEGRVEPRGQLLGGPLVERDDGDRARGRARRPPATRPGRRASSSCPIRPAPRTAPGPGGAVAAPRWSGASRGAARRRTGASAHHEPARLSTDHQDASVDAAAAMSRTWRGEYHLATNTTTSDVEEVCPVRRRWCAPTAVLVERSGGIIAATSPEPSARATPREGPET